MKTQEVATYISNWLKDYVINSPLEGFVIGISGGIDSAVTSALCAQTGKKTVLISMPIHQQQDQLERANEHIEWMKSKFSNVIGMEIDLSISFDTLKNSLPHQSKNHALSMANTRSRLRMLTLYAVGQAENCLVAGTGNKIEDFGVGFFTKYGDGGVDLSPIADLTKTQVFELAKHLNIIDSIQHASPTDGLWETDRTDEDQLGATYPELEWAMDYLAGKQTSSTENLNKRQKEVLAIYHRFHAANKHKMIAIPVCTIPKKLLQ